MTLNEALNNKKDILENTDFNPYYKLLNSGLSDKILIENEKFINLAANNYLGLADDIRIKDAVKEGIDKYGVSLCGTPIAVGYSEIANKLEKKIAKFVGVEDCIILPSCYQANNGLFQVIAEKNDIIVFDHYVHSSLLQGIQSANCKNRAFLHNDMEHLETILSKSEKYEKIWVVTESVFSTEGTIAPLKSMVELCKKYNAQMIVDDSHGIGVIGEKGRGILEHSGVMEENVIYTASLGKAISNLGGVVGGKKETIDFLRYYFPHLIYSTALPPMIMFGINKVIEIIEEDFDAINEKIWRYKKIIGEALRNAGFDIVDSESPINSIKGGDKITTINIAKKFYEKGVLVTPFVEPSVPTNEGRVRMIAGANLTDETIKELVGIIGEMKCHI